MSNNWDVLISQALFLYPQKISELPTSPVQSLNTNKRLNIGGCEHVGEVSRVYMDLDGI